MYIVLFPGEEATVCAKTGTTMSVNNNVATTPILEKHFQSTIFFMSLTPVCFVIMITFTLVFLPVQQGTTHSHSVPPALIDSDLVIETLPLFSDKVPAL